jgi:SSS family solute:Na+ symporter
VGLKISGTDLLVMAIYLLLITFMGLYFSKKNTSTEEYFLGGRRFSGWAIGLSMVGTAISSITFLAMPADAFKTTWIRFITYAGLPIAALVATFWVINIFRAQQITSVYEYLENRFGVSIRIYGSITYVMAQLMRISVVLYLLALLFHEISGMNIVLCILAVGIFVGFYTVVGGIDAVIWTDVLQTIILALGSVIGLLIITQNLPGGFYQVIDMGISEHKFGFGDMINGKILPTRWDFSLSDKTAAMILFAGISFFLTEYLSSQHMIQRFCAARSTAEAKKGLWINVCVSLPVWTFYMLFGTALYVYFIQYPAKPVTDMLVGTSKAEQIVPYFILNHMPEGLVGLMLAAALAAGMSSLDSSINSISTVTVTDLFKRYFARNKLDIYYLSIAKYIATMSAVIMILGALLLNHSEGRTLQDLAFILSSVFTGGIMGLFAFGLFTRLGDARSVWGGIVATMCFTLWMISQPFGYLPDFLSLSRPIDLYYTGFIGNMVMFSSGFILSTLLPRRNILSDSLTIWSSFKEIKK